MDRKVYDEMAHDLRNSMTILALSTKSLAKYIRIVYDEGERALGLLNSMMECEKCSNSANNHRKD